MNNIFENAYFGKAYKTRDGKKAIYLRMFIYNGYNYLFSTGNLEFFVNDKGKVDKSIYPFGEDIVSKWQEPIDDGKLEAMAQEYVHQSKPLFDGDCVSCYMAGYRKAKEE